MDLRGSDGGPRNLQRTKESIKRLFAHAYIMRSGLAGRLLETSRSTQKDGVDPEQAEPREAVDKVQDH